MATRSRQSLRNRPELQADLTKKSSKRPGRGSSSNIEDLGGESEADKVTPTRRASARTKSQEQVDPQVEQSKRGRPRSKQTQSSNAPEPEASIEPRAVGRGRRNKDTTPVSEGNKRSQEKSTEPEDPANDDDDLRRSSRRRSGKSALELLGITPRKARTPRTPQVEAISKDDAAKVNEPAPEAPGETPPTEVPPAESSQKLVLITPKEAAVIQEVQDTTPTTIDDQNSNNTTVQNDSPIVLAEVQPQEPQQHVEVLQSEMPMQDVETPQVDQVILIQPIVDTPQVDEAQLVVETPQSVEAQHIIQPPGIVEIQPIDESQQIVDTPLTVETPQIIETPQIQTSPIQAAGKVRSPMRKPNILARARDLLAPLTQGKKPIGQTVSSLKSRVSGDVREVNTKMVSLSSTTSKAAVTADPKPKKTILMVHTGKAPKRLEKRPAAQDTDMAEPPAKSMKADDNSNTSEGSAEQGWQDQGAEVESEETTQKKFGVDSYMEEMLVPSSQVQTMNPDTAFATPASVKPPTSKKKSAKKKIVKAIVITPSGEKKEIKLTKGVSTVQALEHILAGTTSGSGEDLAQLAADVNKQIEESIESQPLSPEEKELEDDERKEAQRSKYSMPLPKPSSVPLTRMTKTFTPRMKTPSKPDKVVIVRSKDGTEVTTQETEVMTVVANVDSDDKVAYEALSQLASGTPLDQPITIQSGDSSIVVDENWLQEHGLKVVVADEKDERWHRQMVGVEDPPALAQLVNRMTPLKVRARPEKHLVASEDLQEMINNLKPDDNMANHVSYEIVGNTRFIKCNHCGDSITDKHHFRKHMTKHTDVDFKPWKCPICHYRAQVRAQIARHVNIHGELKPYVCKECGKGFNFKQKLLLHLKYHLDIRDKPCPLCKLSFHEHKTLKNHIKKIHKIDPVPPELLASKKYDKGKASTEELERLVRESKVRSAASAARAEPKKLAKSEPVERGTEPDKASNEASYSETEPHKQKETQDEPAMAVLSVTPEVQTPEVEHTVTVDQVATETQDEEGSSSTPDQITIEPADDKAKVKAPSLLYGTRKTFLYTQQYKMGLLPAADRNNIPGNELLSTVRELKGNKKVVTEDAETSQEVQQTGVADAREENPPTIVAPKMSSSDQLEPVLRKYCRIEGQECQLPLFFCEVCEIEPFNSKTGFIHHLEQKHPHIKAWQCPQCDYNCRMRSSLIVHMKLHSGIKDYPCEMCGKAFAFKQKLKNHMKHHLNLREYDCKQCDKAFNEKNDLTKHIKKVHQSERDCVCTVCNKGFKDQMQLRRHMDGHSDTRYLCEHCNKLYRSRVSLAQHMKCHTCMFHCEICDKNFGSYSGFMAHKVMHDESYEGYECELCKKILHTKGSLTRHLAISHSNERPFHCEECGKQFKTKKDLKNHYIVHQEGRKYACEVCEFTCKRPESLRVHMRRHSDVKPFQCGVCGKEYTQKHALETHLRHHTGKVEGMCNICGREFFTRYQLETHMKRKHPANSQITEDAMTAQQHQPSTAEVTAAGESGEKPVTVFMCEECNSVFMTQDSLAVHILAEHMKQSWLGTGDVEMGAVESNQEEVLQAYQPGMGAATVTTGEELLEESQVDNTIEVIEESDNIVNVAGDAATAQTSNHGFDMQQTVETLVSISNPGASGQQRLVSLIHPVETQPEQSAIEIVPGNGLDSPAPTADVAEAKIETAQDKLNALYQQPPQPAAHEAYVAITDPSSNQEMLVAMPHSNFESLLAATEAQVQSDGTFITTTGEDYYTVSTEGDLTTESFVTISSDVMAAGDPTVMAAIPTASIAIKEQEEEEGGAVTETIDIPIEMECVTVTEAAQ